MRPPDSLVSHSAVLASLAGERELRAAIEASRNTLGEFFDALKQKGPRQVDFFVTVMQARDRSLAPLGVAADEVVGDLILGRTVLNALEAVPSTPAACRIDHVIDWRYNDTFECEGRRLFRAALARLAPHCASTLLERQPFVLEWYDRDAMKRPIVFDRLFRDLFRDVANLRYSSVACKLTQDKSLMLKKGYVPSPSGALRCRLKQMTVPHQAAAYADRRMMELLRSLGVFDVDPNRMNLLRSAAAHRNRATAEWLLDNGFDANVVDEHGASALDFAVANDDAAMVELLLARGADCSRMNRNRRTVLFRARSATVAKRLLDAGASPNATDEDGKSCIQYHLEDGKLEVVEVLRRYGAAWDPRWRLGPTEEEIREAGRETLRAYWRQQSEGSSDFEDSLVLDYGCILPMRQIPMASS